MLIRAATEPSVRDEGDPLRDQGAEYAQALMTAGVPVTYTNYDGMVHVFFQLGALLDSGARCVAQVAAFAKEAGWRSLRRCSRTIIDLENLDTERLLPGMSVKVVVQGATRHNVLLAPRLSIRWRQSGPRLVLADSTEVAVVLGPCNSHVCVVEEGIEEGTALFLSALTRDSADRNTPPVFTGVAG